MSDSYGALPAIWDHTVLSATRHRCEYVLLQLQADRPVLYVYRPTPKR